MSEEALWRVGWLAAVMCVLAYSAHLFFGSVAEAEADAIFKNVDVFDLIATTTKTHRLSGMLIVPTRCHSLSWETERLDEARYHIRFTTFGDIHGCKEEIQARAFRTFIVEPSDNWTVTAELDGEPLGFRIVRTNYTDEPLLE